MTTISFRLPDEEKMELESICQGMGMSMATFLNICVKTVIRERKIPFEVAAPDPLYSEESLRRIKHSIAQLKNGQVVHKTLEELEAMEDA